MFLLLLHVEVVRMLRFFLQGHLNPCRTYPSLPLEMRILEFLLPDMEVTRRSCIVCADTFVSSSPSKNFAGIANKDDCDCCKTNTTAENYKPAQMHGVHLASCGFCCVGSLGPELFAQQCVQHPTRMSHWPLLQHGFHFYKF